MRILVGAAAAACALTAYACFGDIPGKINYHGKITTPAGLLVEGAHDMVFRMFAAPSGGTEKWSETHAGVPIANGLCNVVLGSATGLTPVFQENEALYLEVSVDGETLLPRQEVASVGYAMRASRDNPVGTIQMYGGADAPPGWLLCRGQAVSRTGYAALFAVLGTTYGVGDGSTTFNLPDGRGRVPVGVSAGDASFDALGETGGEKTHALTEAEMPGHTHAQNEHGHGVTDPGHFHAIGKIDGTSTGSLNRDNSTTSPYTAKTQSATTSISVNSATATNQNAGGGGAHNNLQPYIAWNYIIKD